MQIWLDSINLELIKDAERIGIISGITTNPSILSKTKNVPETLSSLLKIQKGPVAVQVTATNSKDIIEESKKLFDFSNRIIIKIPINNSGLYAIQKLHKENIPVLGTAIFHPTQALLAANQGASYIAPYFSHISDIGNAKETLKTIVTLLRSYNYQTKILAASLRNLDDLIFCTLLSIDAVTIKDDLYYKLTSENNSLKQFSQKFSSDWKQVHGDSSITELLTLPNLSSR